MFWSGDTPKFPRFPSMSGKRGYWVVYHFRGEFSVMEWDTLNWASARPQQILRKVNQGITLTRKRLSDSESKP